jgi:hypothetical protein
MKRLNGLVSTAVAMMLAGAGAGASAQPPQVKTPTAAPAADDRPVVPAVAKDAAGSLHGVVSDEAGGPVEGVTVSAIGETMVFAITDRKGRFQFDNLPAGQYLLRANRAGFSLPRREYVNVRGSARAVKWLSLQRSAPVATSGESQPQILAAGLGGQPLSEEAPPDPVAADGTTASDPGSPHPHTEAAWRLRHLRRNVLKDSTEIMTVSEEGPAIEAADFARAPAFGSLFAALPFSGEINLLTSGSLTGPGQLFGDGLPHGITYVQLGNTTENTAGWAVQAAMSEGDVSSWIVAGSFSARGPRAHAFETGLSFGAQEYAGGNPAMLAVRSDGSRRVGGVYGYDNWAVSPRVHLTYGARVATYDYVDRDNLWSPRVALALNVASGTHLRAAVSQRMRAPGAEEFLPPQNGPWIPPERTFSPIDGNDFRVERIRQLELTLEREFQDSAVISVRRFVEQVDDQLVTIFGAEAYDGAPRSDVGHYLVGSAGAVDAEGWGVKVASASTKRLRGSLDYTLTRARWAPDAVAAAHVAPLARSAVRTEREDVHDLAMTGEADIVETATRVFFYYRVSTGYARADDSPQPAFGGRFDLQVKQGLPFIPLRGSEWQVLVGIRDLFRDPLDSSSSTYDELLVVRPPKRVIGGVQVKF